MRRELDPRVRRRPTAPLREQQVDVPGPLVRPVDTRESRRTEPAPDRSCRTLEGVPTPTRRVRARPARQVRTARRLGPRLGRSVEGALGRHQPGLDELGQEHGGRVRGGGVPPVRARQQEVVPRARHRDVGEAPLLAQLVRTRVDDELLTPQLELLGAAGIPVGEHRQVSGITAQRVGQRAEAREPSRVPRTARPERPDRREDAVAQAGDHDHVPLESLGTVHRDELHRIRVRVGDRAVEPTLLSLGSLEPRQERSERRQRRVTREVRRDPAERVQVGAPATGTQTRPGAHLDVEPEEPLGLGHELRQGQVGVLAQQPQRDRQVREPVVRGRAQGSSLWTCPPAPGEVLEGVDDAPVVDHVALEVPRSGARTDELGRPVGESVQVGGTEPQPWARQQPHEGVATRRVVGGLQRRHQVGHLGRGQQPAQPDDLDRDAPGAQRLPDRGELGALATQHRRRDRRRHLPSAT